MDRRKSIKSILLGSVAGGLAVNGCKPDSAATEEVAAVKADEKYFGRTPKELEEIEEINAKQFFTAHELETIAVLSNLILPPGEKGGIKEAGVPEFIEFMAKDVPELQTDLRGGLMWLEHKSNTSYGKEFKNASVEEQKKLLDPIAFYDSKLPMSSQPVEIQFFALMRNLTLTGYYTSRIGIEELGYKGNTAAVWDGVPQEVLDQHGMAYDEAWIAKCVDQSKRGVIAEWDASGKLLT